MSAPFFGGTELVDCSEDAVQEAPVAAVVDCFGGRDEGDAGTLQLVDHKGVFDAVAVHPGELVDDDVVDVLVGLDPGEHLLERDSFVHAGGGAARLDVLTDDVETEGAGFAFADLGEVIASKQRRV